MKHIGDIKGKQETNKPKKKTKKKQNKTSKINK